MTCVFILFLSASSASFRAFFMPSSLFFPRPTILAATILFGALFPASQARADAVVLKGGERIEGKILSETDTDVTIQYKVTASISDERVVKKTDVDKIEKAAPDIEAWAQFKDFKLGDDSMDPTAYTHYIGGLKGFLAQFPQSANAGPAKTLLDSLEAEKKRMDGGEYKLDGKWLTKQEVQKERIQILGNSYLRQIKRFAAAGRVQDAMSIFDVMEKQALGSTAYPEAVEIARRGLIALKQAAETNHKRLSDKANDDKQALDKLHEPQKSQVAHDLKYLRDTAEANVAALERSGVKWMPLSPATEKSMSALANKAGSELVRLNGLPLESMRQSLREAEKAKASAASGDLPAAEAGFAKASQLWAANDFAKRGMADIAEARKAETAKMAADKIAAAEAVKQAEADAEAAKKRAIEATLKAPPTPEPAAAVAEEPPPPEASFFSKPAGWIMLVVLLAFGALIAKVIRKFRDPSGNILDQ